MYRVCAVGGHIRDENDSNGNMFTVPSKKYAEFNRSLHPLAVRTACYFKHSISLLTVLFVTLQLPVAWFLHLWLKAVSAGLLMLMSHI
jgi:hypothetical protein